MDELNVNQVPQTETIDSLKLHNNKPKKTAADWVRDMRMSAAVNKATTGVETEQVTPDLLLATSKKLLGISKREQEPDAKDSLAFQRFYGPEMLFSERIQRDGGKLARNILWKATNKGNLDFMPVNALDKHISSVFYDSKLAQMMDGSSPLETIDSAYKTTRLGEGGVSSMESAPDEMRTVQPSYFGFIDPVRCFAKGTEIKTEEGWKPIESVTTDDRVLTWVNGKSEYVNPTEVMTFDYSDEMIGYNDGTVAFLVTPHHRMWIHWDDTDSWGYAFAEDVVGGTIMINISDNDTPVPYVLTEEDWYKITNKPYGKVHCLTVSGGLIYCRYLQQQGFICGQSPESQRIGLDVYMTKNVMKGTDGKLYQKFIDAKTGKEVLLDSETAANSIIASNEMMDAKTKAVFALGGKTGIRIVPKDSVQYYLPRADEAYSAASNLVTMLSGVKEMRLQMGCLHPDTHVLTINKHNLISIKKAQVTKDGSIPGSTKEGSSKVFPIRTTVAKFPPKRNWFYKVVLRSGRSLITSADHRWSVLRNGKYSLIQAKDLKPGDAALRTTFKDVISRRTFVNGMLVNKDLATVLGYIARTLAEPDNIKMRFSIPEERYRFVMQQLARIGYTEGFNTYYMNQATFCIGVRDEAFKQFLEASFGADPRERRIPDFIMSANAAVVGAFLDGYTTDPTLVGRDSADDIWVLDIPNTLMRDSLAFLFARIETDTLYRDTLVDGKMYIAMKLAPMEPVYGDMLLDEIKVVRKGISAPIMIDIDIDDNLYAVANGIVTHNSKYPLQAISISSREAPLVRGLDEATGKDMHTLIGKYLGARFAPKSGVVTAVRKDRIDVLYDDGTKGSIGMYINFPMNAKGYITNTPRVKAGQAFKEGDCLASSNYTDDKGVAALGTNLRSAWMSWKGGTYEDAIVISESAAKKLTSTTMYKTAVDLDKTVKLGKQNYITWKPGEFTKEQMENLDANGIVKPGTVLHKEDPMILAVRMTEPSPGTLGKRILTDMSERWEHDHPGVVTDVVKTRNGIKVYATVTAPAEIGDKVSNSYGAKGVLSQIIPDDEMPTDSKGRPFEILFSPLSLISRCYDDKTEFLTESGWKLGKDIAKEDQLYCYDPITNTVAMGKQLDTFYSASYSGKMYGYHDDTVDFLVSPSHRIWAKLRAKFETVLVQDIYREAVTIPIEKDGYVYYYQLSPDCWYIEDYKGKIYCPTVSTGFIVTKRKGSPVCLGNTNPSQLFEAQLGKVAAKTGKPVVVPQFFKGSITDFVEDQLKQNHLKADEDLQDPVSGKVMPDVTTGVSYIYKLKHLSESKLSARGTSSYDCYSEDTEVLTDTGWKPWSEVTMKDRFWTCKDGIWFYAKASKLHVYNIDDDMIHITSRYIDSLVTKNHKHIVGHITRKKAYGVCYKKTLAEDLLKMKRFNLPQFGYKPQQSTIDIIHIPDYTTTVGNRVVTYPGCDIDAVALASLMGWLASEGHIPKATDDHRNRCTLYQLEAHKAECDDIEKTLDACGLGWQKRVEAASRSGNAMARYTFNNPALTDWARRECGTHSSNKRIPRELMRYTNTRAAFFKSYMLGDGSETTRTRVEGKYTWFNERSSATTVSKGLADDLMELAMLEGFGAHCRCNIRTRSDGRSFNYPVWTVQFHKKRTCATIDTHDPRYTGKVALEHYVGKVYCATIPETGVLCVRRNGKILISGNSDQVPAGKGMDGCFPGSQQVLVKGLPKSINTLAFSLNTYQVATCTLEGEPCYYPAIDSFRKLVKPSELLTITPKWSFTPHGMLMKEPVAMTPTKNHAIYMYDMTMRPAGELKVGDMLAGIGLKPSADMRQVLANLLTSPGSVIDDKLTVTYKEGHEKLAAFKCRTLAKLDVRLDKEARTITVPMYTMYQALLKDSDFGDIAVCLHQLDSEAGCTDEKLIGLIAKFIPSYIIPESMATLKATVHKKQRRHKPEELDKKMTSGLMPIMVADIGPYVTDKEQLKVYDLTIDTTHRYVLYGGFLVSNSKRFGTLEQSALAGHGVVEDVVKDAKYIRGQSNSDFWRSLRTGDIPTMPGEPLVHKKFFAHLTGAGIRVKKTPQGVSIFALTNKDVNELANTRELRSRDTYEARNFRPIDGGLFGQDIFGMDGTKWGYIQLDEPVPNPVMEEPLARLLGIPEKKFADVAAGRETINGISGGESMKKALEKIDLGAESAKALSNFKSMSPSGKDKALKRYIAIERMRRAGVNPAEYMLDRIPVIPPVYRPITSHNGLTMVADSNYLYAQLMDARDDAREAKGLPKEFQQQARENIYTKWKELTGLYAPQDVKLQSKHVQGLLKWALGDSPKFSGFQRKVLSATVDTVGRGAITPDPRLKLNEVGLPKPMAFGIFAPMVQRKLVKMGYTPLQAMEKVKKQDTQAVDALNEVMDDHPVLINRAPTLHKLSIIGLNAKIAPGNAIRINPSIVSTMAADFDGNCVDFDSKIFLKISKSRHNKEGLEYVNSVSENQTNKETLFMKLPYETKITAHDTDDNDYVCIKIGEFPRLGEPVKDKNGANCYAVPEGIQVLSCDPATGKESWQTIKMLTVEDDCDTVKVKLGARELIVSTNESMAVFDHATGLLTKVAPDKAAKAMVPVFKQHPAPYGTYGTRDLGWMLGAYISDGWTAASTIGYAKLEEAKRNEFVRIVRSLHENFTVKTYSENTNGHSDAYKLGNSVKVHLNSSTLVAWFSQFDCINPAAMEDKTGKRTALFKQVPSYLIDYGSEEFLWGLFSGLLDGDGCVVKNIHTGRPRWGIRFNTSSPYLKDDICQLCYRLGLRYSVTTTDPRGFSNEAYTIIPSTIDMYKNLDKLTCIGEREAGLIAEWKKCKPSMDNYDILPISETEYKALKLFITQHSDSGLYSAIMRTYRDAGCRANRALLMRHVEDIKEYAPSLYERMMATNTIWETVSSVEPAGKRQVFDFEVEGTKVFAINNGVVIWDTVNIHAPVSDAARKAAYNKMMPERNLIGMRSREILYKPEKEYQQGLYIATRMKTGADVRTHYFNTLEEAKQAYRDGLIDVDDPIEIKHK